MEQPALLDVGTCRLVRARSVDRTGRHHFRCTLPTGHRGKHRFRWVLVERYQ